MGGGRINASNERTSDRGLAPCPRRELTGTILFDSGGNTYEKTDFSIITVISPVSDHVARPGAGGRLH